MSLFFKCISWRQQIVVLVFQCSWLVWVLFFFKAVSWGHVHLMLFKGFLFPKTLLGAVLFYWIICVFFMEYMCSCRGNFLLPCIIVLNEFFCRACSVITHFLICVSFEIYWPFSQFERLRCWLPHSWFSFVSELEIYCSMLFCFLVFLWKTWVFSVIYAFVCELGFFFL